MGTFLRGIWSGIFATSAMTLAMFQFHRKMEGAGQEPLPPATLTKSVLQKTLQTPASKEGQMESTLLSHMMFGAACGVVYSLIAPHIKTNNLVKGAGFAMGVWGVSYLGVLPALNLEPKAKNQTPQQNLMMVATHLIYGASLGYAEEKFRNSGQKMLGHARS